MAGKGTGGGTSFEDMSHEEMLAWLDQANSGEVQSAADRLTTAAKEIRKIAEELKVRPQWVEWKGEGANAFRTWAGDLANSTLRLGDFSEGAAKWLSEASGAIATAQASVPRDSKSAQANLSAAKAAHNDPDAAAISVKSRSELAALAADCEKVRQEAAAQMRKLGQSYSWSATQINALERPKFPPPPAAVLSIDQGSEDMARPETAASGTTRRGGSSSVSGRVGTTGAARGHAVTSGGLEVNPSASPELPHRADRLGPRSSVDEPATHVGIDSLGVVPEVHHSPADVPGGAPATPRPNPEVSPVANGVVPPRVGGPSRVPSASGGPGRPAPGGRLPTQSGHGAAGTVPGRGVTGPGAAPSRGLSGSGAPLGGRALPGQGMAPGRGVPASSGITGGRPAATSGTGRPVGRLPGGTVVGGESAGSRNSAGGRSAAGPRGQSVIRSPEPTAGQSVSSPRDGVTGGRVRQTGRTPTRPGAPVPSAPTRGGISGGVPGGSGTRGATAGETGGARRRRWKQTDRRDEPRTEDR